MNRWGKILKYLLLGVAGLIVILLIGLNLFYQQQYAASLQREAQLGRRPAAVARPPAEELPAPNPTLLPLPQQLTLRKGTFTMPAVATFSASDTLKAAFGDYLQRLFEVELSPAAAGTFRFERTASLPLQGYQLDISPRQVTIHYREPVGAYYALTTLQQLRNAYPGGIPCLSIEDFPDLNTRGVMLDISRDKVPTLTTLYGLVDYLSALKYNHLQLYVEGFSFGYPSYRDLWEGKETPITPEEIRQLDSYCRERFIELVPNQNSLGHMAAWLATDRFADLAECPDGFSLTPFLKMKMTLDPYDPRSIELVKQMMADLLPNFSSSRFNANLDEPFELGHCKSKEAAEAKGVGKVYLEFAEKVHQLSRQHGKEMLMWADIASKHPEILPEISPDITLLEWGYEAEHPFDINDQQIQTAGLNFMNCPGTSSWMSLTGRTDNMLANIDNAVENSLQYGAEGILLTDWGDLGHWQYLPVSYGPLAYGAAKSWNDGGLSENQLAGFLDRSVFHDASGQMGQFALDLGRYNQFEEMYLPSMTYCFIAYQFGLVDRVLFESILGMMQESMTGLVGETIASRILPRFDDRQAFQYDALMNYLDDLENQLNASSMKIPDADLVRAEFQNGITMVRLGANLVHFNLHGQELTAPDRLTLLKTMAGQCRQVIAEHRRLWLSRNKTGGLERSTAALKKLESQIQRKLELEEKGGLAKAWERLKNRVIAAGAALFF